MALLVGWGLAAAAGARALWVHALTAGPSEAAPSTLPADLAARTRPGAWSLWVFVHPRCPCSRATLTELARLMEDSAGHLTTRVFVGSPRQAPRGWERGELWAQAAAIPGVEVTADVDGAMARRLGAQTSGQVVLYGPDGTHQFSGGLTVARGHEGDSEGGRAIRALLASRPASSSSTPVFGCLLGTPASP
ncbi:RedB protein [Corallococcus sp. M34]|uniref:RedB protein n=1 Tax=Citreicoccus inhibens TaxID=2849499 RepID=UPI001C236170|nr:RedB protein [Citreicoccus inhibens]MBU8899815.1 RedB protein [Citreicoccus inhibens]